MQDENKTQSATEFDAALRGEYSNLVQDAFKVFSGQLAGLDVISFIDATEEIGAKLQGLVDKSIELKSKQAKVEKLQQSSTFGKFAKPWPLDSLHRSDAEITKSIMDNALKTATSSVKSATEEFEHAFKRAQDEQQAGSTYATPNGEYITKLAANMVGRELVGYYWDASRRGYVNMKDRRESFAPLSDPGDAYRIENELAMSVKYTVIGKEKTTCIRVASQCGKKAVGRMVKESESMLECRMEAVVQLAAMLAS